LSEHVIDERLHVSLLGRGQVAGGISCVLKFPGLDYDIFQLGPFQKIAIVSPLRDYTDGTDDAALVGVNLVGGRAM